MDKVVVLHAESTFVGPFWEENDFCNLGDIDEFWIDDIKYNVDFPGFKDWFMKSDMYDPYSDIDVFTLDGFDEWVNQGYIYATMLRELLPKEITVFYGFWKNFGDDNWRYCKAYISK